MTLLAEFLSDVMTPQHVRLDNIPDVQLDQHWYDFETTLGKYKQEYKEKLELYRKKEIELSHALNNITILQNTLNVLSDELHDTIQDWIANYRESNAIDVLKDELSNISGTIRAMEAVLMNTNAKRYSQFTCSICMERMVDTFLDPCGHLTCERCFFRTRSNDCPMCRSHVHPKKMFPTS